MDMTLALGKISSIRKDPHNYVTHLLFADDMIVFIKANKASAKGIKDILGDLAATTGFV